MVVGVAVIMYIVVIFVPSLYIVIGVLIESAKGVVVVQLVVKACPSLKIGIALNISLPVGNHP